MGTVRVSRRAGREGDSFVSPTDQAGRIQEACDRDDLTLVPIGNGVREIAPGIAEEIDVSGGTPLAERPGLLAEVEAIEAGRADVLVVAYFDRLVRSLKVQGEVVSRVEAAGGQVLAVDVGAVSEATASKWLSGSMLGLVAEYHRRSAAERSAEAQADAVARGVAPFPHVPAGYDRGEDGVLVANGDAPTIAKAFQMRADGASIDKVRDYLRRNGVERSFHAVQEYLGSKVVLGEIHFGKLVNLSAHPPIVDRSVWEQVQSTRVLRGRRGKSDYLLARLGVLRCATCDARMVVGRSGGSNPGYRCPATGDCTARAHIAASKVEPVVVDAVKAALADVAGKASVETNAREAEQELDAAQKALDAAILAFTGLEGEGSAQQRLTELRETRDDALERVDQLRGAGDSLTISVADWDKLSHEGRRDLIQAVIRRVTVAPGRGKDRVTVELVAE